MLLLVFLVNKIENVFIVLNITIKMSEKLVSFNSKKRVYNKPVLNTATLENVELSLEQQYILKKFENGENLFITGPGGTGKTMLIQHMIKKALQINKNIQVTALTGCAALLLKCKAKTIHSWSGIKIARGSKMQIISNILKNSRSVGEWRKTQILVVDEVSMMSEKIFDTLEEAGRVVRKNNLPFGGMQVIFCGDFYQLPPVGNSSEPETCRFCFESEKWNCVFKKDNHIPLTHIFRQNDPTYINILQQIRLGELSEENRELLQKYVCREKPENMINPVKLFPIRSKVDYINSIMFSKLETEEVKFPYIKKKNCDMYIDSGIFIPEELLNLCSRLSTKDIEYTLEQLLTNTQMDGEMSLKIGALVMCTFNVDVENGICNGSTGIIQGFANTQSRAPIVKWSCGLTTTMEIRWVQSEDFPSIAIGQYPLRLSWASTIHKIQGATLDTAEIDLGSSVFEFAQTYVGLSRVRSLDGLFLTAFNPNKIKANAKVRAFYDTIKPISEEEMKSFINIDNIELDFDEFSYKSENINESNDIKVVKLR